MAKGTSNKVGVSYFTQCCSPNFCIVCQKLTNVTTRSNLLTAVQYYDTFQNTVKQNKSISGINPILFDIFLKLSIISLSYTMLIGHFLCFLEIDEYQSFEYVIRLEHFFSTLPIKCVTIPYKSINNMAAPNISQTTMRVKTRF